MPLLDSCFLIDILKGDAEAVRLLDLLRQGSAPLGVSPLAHFELWAGVGRSRLPREEEQAVESLLGTLTVFDFTPAAARQAGLLEAELAAKGRKPSLLDLFIGCTAVQAGQDLVTRNGADFTHIPGLRVLEY